MFDIGQKIVCINDDFDKLIRLLYKELPKKGNTYTVRHVDLGRGRVFSTKAGENETTYLVLLQEIHNPDDPRCQGQSLELGFRSDRFATLEQLQESEELEEYLPAPAERELVHV